MNISQLSYSKHCILVHNNRKYFINYRPIKNYATTTDTLGKSSLHPIYISLGNIPTWRRNKEDAKQLLGYFPILFAKNEKEKTSPEFKKLVRETFYKSLKFLLDPLFENENGIDYKINNRIIWFFPKISTIIGDWPEACTYSLTYKSASSNFPCHFCLVQKNDLIDTMQDQIILRNHENMMEHFNNNTGHSVSLEPVENYFWNIPNLNIYAATVPDRMHHLDLGLYHYQIEFIKGILGRSSIDKMNERIGAIPRYPGLKIFSKGLQSIARLTASEYRDLMKVMVFVVDGLLSNDLSEVYVKWNEMYILSRLGIFKESDLEKFQKAINEWADLFVILFRKKSDSKMKFLKFHSWIFHIVDTIQEYRAINGYTTETYENPLFENENGIDYKINNRIIWFFPKISTIIGDWPEACTYSLTYKSASSNFPCHFCLVQKNDLIDTMQDQIILRNHENMMEHFNNNTGHSVSLEPVENYFWNILNLNIYAATVPDRMHHLDLGLYHYQIEFIKGILGRSSIDKMNERIGAIPRYPGLKIFSKGLQSIARLTASEYRDLMKVMVFVVDGLLSNDLSEVYVKWNEMYILSRLGIFKESDLEKFQKAINEWADLFVILFRKKSDSKMKFLKFHSWIFHIVDTIQEYRAINGYTTETYESLHKSYVKTPYRLTIIKRRVTKELHKTPTTLIYTLKLFEFKLLEASIFFEQQKKNLDLTENMIKGFAKFLECLDLFFDMLDIISAEDYHWSNEQKSESY
ncbi:hypothetical protein Glove_41g186 [Diversispora epigaea]|uniref:Uncharacterized protein n=1 Tax=Diversispora epigaea TaxID=1348612 RepID=A0A397JJH9_9GLOM|nr:hypothetical protein Glove_41g186 [Diversispora epigaea]